jgi:hypothetical protein
MNALNALKVIRTISEVATMTNDELEFFTSCLVNGMNDETIAEKLQFQMNVKIQERLLSLEKEIA